MSSKIVVCVLVCLFSAQFANADLVMSVNSANETVAFFGSDTGTADGDGGYTWGSFILGQVVNLSGSGLPDDDGATLAVSTDGIQVFGMDTSNPGGTLNIVGSGIALDYSGLNELNKTILEGAIGTTIAPNFTLGSSGFSPISIVGVPEPSGVAFLALAAFACAGLRRKR